MKKLLLALCMIMTISLCACAGDEIAPASTMGNSTATILPTQTPTPTPEPAPVYPIQADPEALSWIAGKMGADQVILTPEQIEQENQRMLEAGSTLTDILQDKPATLSRGELNSLLYTCYFPDWARTDSLGQPISQATVDGVHANRGLANVQEVNPVRMGIVTQRGDLKTLPTSEGAFKSAQDLYDRLQGTEVFVGMPVWVYHTSADGQYYFIQTYFYQGWVSVKCIALTEDETIWRTFGNPTDFVTVLRPLLTVGEAKCDMGVRLPYISRGAGNFTVQLPVRQEDGTLSAQEARISYEDGYLGWVPYTYEKFITQAFLYKGTMYGYGGLNDGVDCSGFVAAVFRTFGFYLPRNTGGQQTVVGSAVSVSGQGHQAIRDRLAATTNPTAIYLPGHTLIYLGESNEGSVFIHAPAVGEVVQVTTKTNLANALYINEVGPQ
ncbi:MAG: SH3 domain-containing protein [Clostridia bacterium]|nr:SH3 domain-containing protein [Clostridia bacterium]